MIPDKKPNELKAGLALLKQTAIRFGATDSAVIFSGDIRTDNTCCVVADKLPCRHMNEARPSLSGFGIDVIQLMNTSGWPVVKTEQHKGGPEDSSWVAGLILVF
jgi:predicted metal-binding protein